MKKIINLAKQYLISIFFIYSKQKRNKPSFYTNKELVKEILNGKSIARFGDGELKIIFGSSIRFQQYSLELKKDLIDCLLCNNDNLITCLPEPLYTLDNLNKKARRFYKVFSYQYGKSINHLIDKNKKYGNTQITRFYMDYKNKERAYETITGIKRIWDNRNILIVEGYNTMLGVGNDLFANAKSIRRILVPNKNSYQKKDIILEEIYKNLKKGDLVLLAAGPTATVISFYLSTNKVQSVDIGHIDIEYEWLIRKAKKKIPILHKNVNEINDNKDNTYRSNGNKEYNSQIIVKI